MTLTPLSDEEKKKLRDIAQKINEYRQKYFPGEKYDVATLSEQVGNNLDGTCHVTFYVTTHEEHGGCTEGDLFSRNLDLVAAREEIRKYIFNHN